MPTDLVARMTPGTKCLLYPTDTGRYLNLVLYQQFNSSTIPGLTLTSWVYDREEDRLFSLMTPWLWSA